MDEIDEVSFTWGEPLTTARATESMRGGNLLDADPNAQVYASGAPLSKHSANATKR